jgi:predicted DNA-binding transcriptional regulator
VINPNNYYTVQGWMLSELGLKGNALAVYAIIYGFSQDGVSEYAGSSRYLCEWLGCSKKTVLTTLAGLTERGLLRKKTVNQNGVMLCNYVAVRRPLTEPAEGGVKITPPAENLPQGGEENTPGRCKNYTGVGEEITPHIDIDNNKDIHKDMNKGTAPASPPPPADNQGKGKGEKPPKPPKQEYGEYKHVKLTADEYAKLLKKHGAEKAAALIKYLDEYMEERPKYKSESHYLAIGRWVVDAVNEKARRSGQAAQPWSAARGGRQAGPVGPNGIALDTSKNDVAEIF